MKKIIVGSSCAVLAVLAGCTTSSVSDEELARQKAPIRPLVCPAPKTMSLETATWVKLDGSVPVSVSCREAGAADWVARHWKPWFEKPVVPRTADASALPQGEGAYRLVAAADGISIAAERLSGVRYALQTLRQLAVAGRGTLMVDHYIAPCVTIEDRPAVSWRGLHFCWFPETTAQEVERFIRLAGAFKFNYVVLETWGTFRSDLFPWLGWKDGAMTKPELRRLRGIAEDLGVTLIPQVNVFGHASFSRGCTGKHATLDFGREYQPLFEPLMGWNWCLTNPETKRVLKAYVAEIHEAFGNPPYVHLGCDEATPPSCPECSRGSYADKVVAHIREMAASVEARGARAIIWHDMFLKSYDMRYAYDYRNGSAEMAAKVAELPRSIIIAEWNYSIPYPDGDYPAHSHFHDLGFDVLTCPWERAEGIDAQGRFAQANPWCGYLGTTWHHAQGPALRTMLVHGAHAAWGGDPKPYSQPWGARFMTVLRQVQWDLPITDRTQAGVNRYQIDPQDDPRN